MVVFYIYIDPQPLFEISSISANIFSFSFLSFSLFSLYLLFVSFCRSIPLEFLRSFLLPLDPLYKILSILKIEIKSQILYLHAHSILYTQNNITLTVLKAHTQSEILPQLGKFYTSTACDACDKFHV